VFGKSGGIGDSADRVGGSWGDKRHLPFSPAKRDI
jgi:hypothetical protein